MNSIMVVIDRFSKMVLLLLVRRQQKPLILCTTKIVKKINYNAYKLKLASQINTSGVFNAKHLIPYVGYVPKEVDNSSRVSFS